MSSKRLLNTFKTSKYVVFFLLDNNKVEGELVSFDSFCIRNLLIKLKKSNKSKWSNRKAIGLLSRSECFKIMWNKGICEGNELLNSDKTCQTFWCHHLKQSEIVQNTTRQTIHQYAGVYICSRRTAKFSIPFILLVMCASNWIASYAPTRHFAWLNSNHCEWTNCNVCRNRSFQHWICVSGTV